MSDNWRIRRAHVLWAVCCLLVFVSCGPTQEGAGSEMDQKGVEWIVSKIGLEGDGVIYVVPNIRLEGTRVYTLDHSGTRSETGYDTEGYIGELRYIGATEEQIALINGELTISIKSGEKEAEGAMDKTLVYGMLMILVFGLLYVISSLEALKLG